MSRFLNRRRIIKAAAAAPLGLPFLAQFAKADERPHKRVIFLMSPNDCMHREEWAMAEQGGNASLPRELPSYLAPLSAFADRLAVFGDLHKKAHNRSHCPQSLLTGTHTLNQNADTNASSISLDQFLAQEMDVDAATFGVRCLPNQPDARWSSLGVDQPVDPIMDPAVAFDLYFGDHDIDPVTLEAKRARKKSLLDRVSGDLTRFQSQVAAHQRPRVEAHLEAVRKIEAELDEGIMLSCDPGSPTFGKHATDNASVPSTLKGLIDMMVQVMACGITRVGSLQFGRSGAEEMRPTWPEAGIDIDRDFHFGLAHRYWDEPSEQATLDRRASETWLATHMVQYLLQELDARVDVDGKSLLDNTMVVWLHEMGSHHNAEGHLAVVAGGSDWLDTGMFRSFPGRGINDLLPAVATKMGFAMDVFGDPEIATGRLPL
ncbi:MAG: DUF1552 domain-containing protein [Myxococcota bacterium]